MIVKGKINSNNEFEYYMITECGRGGDSVVVQIYEPTNTKNKYTYKTFKLTLKDNGFSDYNVRINKNKLTIL